MARFGFCSGTYNSQSTTADAQRCVNFYPEPIEDPTGQSRVALYGCPGSKLFVSLSGASVRGQIAINGRVFAVSGTTLYELSATSVSTVRGQNLTNDGGRVSMAASHIQLLIASGGNLFCLNLTTNEFTAVDGALGAISKVGFADGYFFALESGTQNFQLSKLEDAKIWDALDVFEVSQFADNVVGMLVAHRELWLFGDHHTTVYYDSGDQFNPWQPISGAYLEQGLAAQDSVAILDNSPFWIGLSERGSGVAYRASGYAPQRISNHAVEYEWSTYPKISDAVAYAFEMNGHAFYQIMFPGAKDGLGATWVYDVSTGLWHEREFQRADGQAEAHHSHVHCFAFGKHLVGDWRTSNIYEMSSQYHDDDGKVIRRRRRAPHIATEQKWISHNEMQVLLESATVGEILLPGVSTSPRALVLQDSTGQLWDLSINDSGILQRQTTTFGTVVPWYLNDQITGLSYQVGINTSGALEFIPVDTNSYPKTIQLATSGTQLQSGLQIKNKNAVTLTPHAVYRDPQVMLHWSDDGGKTWGNEHWVSAGAIGKFLTRILWRRLGRARDRVYELVVTDPIPWRIVDAYLDASPGYQPQERYASQIAKVM